MECYAVQKTLEGAIKIVEYNEGKKINFYYWGDFKMTNKFLEMKYLEMF